jgi:penicillin-binding protein 1A
MAVTVFARVGLRSVMGIFRRERVDQQISLPARPAKRGIIKSLPWELRFLILAPIYVGVPLGLALALAFAYYTIAFPNPLALRAKERAPVVRVLARDGSLLTERGGGEMYTPIDLLPQHLLDAVIAVEDRRFFDHWGLDPAGFIRAAFANLREGRFAQGGSTLTQQLAKNLFLNSRRTVGRKAQELVLALWLELRLTKRDILELYLNRVYLGAGAYGVEAAAHRFFGKSAREITLAEGALLAGLLKAPSRYSPASHPATARTRAHSVIAKMAEAGYLSREDADQALRAPLRFTASSQKEQSATEYAVDAALERLPALVGAESRAIVVETTIDAGLQRRAQAIVHGTLVREGRYADATQAGLVILGVDGGIRALVGGRSYAESQFNRALKAKRQPGSTFKPFVYVAALESGLTPDSIVQDLPILGAGWSPRNEGAGYQGAVTLREALAQSMNAATARLHMSIGPRKVAAVAQRLGIRSELRADASLALGTSEVSLLELTGAYGVLANSGRSLEPYVVRSVRTTTGKVLYQHQNQQPKTILAPAHVAAINDMLHAAVVSGTGRRAALAQHPTAGKTGTSQDFRDAWFVGYTAHLIGGVWVGNDDRRPMSRVMGGNLPAKVWREVMTVAHEGRAALSLGGKPQEAAVMPLPADAQAALRHESAQPLLPGERIGAQFIDRAIAR